MQIANPFSGEKLNGRNITRRHYELHKDRFTDYEFNTDRKSDSNEYCELLVHKTEDTYLLVKEPEREYKFS